MSKFVRVFIVSGIPLGLLGALIFTAGPEKSWIDFTLSVIGSALVFGLALGAIAHYTNRFEVSVLNLSIFMGVAGVIAGEVIFFVGNALPHGPWIRIDNPPESVVEFAGPMCYDLGNHTVYVRTENGNLYSYNCTDGRQCLWNKEVSVPTQTSVNSLNAWHCSSHQRLNRRMPPAPGIVVASYQVDDIGVDCAGQTNYVLLKDQSIWKWNNGSCAIGVAVMSQCFAITSFASGFLGFLGLLVLKRKGSW